MISTNKLRIPRSQHCAVHARVPFRLRLFLKLLRHGSLRPVRRGDSEDRSSVPRNGRRRYFQRNWRLKLIQDADLPVVKSSLCQT